MAEEARNVRDYGAKGDGITDDTLAFLHALQKGRNVSNGSKKPASIYVPPGRYLIRSTLIVWSRTQMFGDWDNRPTLVLAEKSEGFQDTEHPNPFIVTAGGYNMPEDTADWRTRTDQINGSTNNTFDIIFRDINLEIGAHNPGAWALFWWCAQQTALRNVNVDGGTSLGCIITTAWGGGSTVAGCNFRGGQTGYSSDATSMEFFRDCVFTGQSQYAVNINGVGMFTFQNLVFDHTAPVQLYAGFHGVINFLNCAFLNISGTPLLDQYRHSTLHLEDVSFGNQSEVPSFLRGVAEDGKVRQWTSSRVVKSGEQLAGSDSSLLEAVCPFSLAGRSIPRPGSKCVNVKLAGAIGDGVHDDTRSIISALRRYSELFFPPGIYRVKGPLTIRAGQRLFGCGVQVSDIELDTESAGFQSRSVQPFVTVEGNQVKGIAIYGLGFINKAPGGICLRWKGDPSSIVMDSTFANQGESRLCPIDIVAGGGFFEELWVPAGSSHRSQGVRIASLGPVWLYSFQPEHYTEYAIALDGATNIVFMNVGLETSAFPGKAGTELRLNRANQIYVYGIGAGNWFAGEATNLVTVKDSQHVSLWNMCAINVPCLVRDESFSAPKTYGPAGSGNNIEDAAVLAGFIK